MFFLSELCCLCLTKNCNLKNLNLIPINKLLLFLEEISEIPLNVEKFICEKCCGKLDVIHEFQEMCLKSLTKFKNYVSQLESITNYKPKSRKKVGRKNKTSVKEKNVKQALSNVAVLPNEETVEGSSIESETHEDSFTSPIETNVNGHYPLVKKEENVEDDSFNLSKEIDAHMEYMGEPEANDMKDVVLLKQEINVASDEASEKLNFNQEFKTIVHRQTRKIYKCFNCDKGFTSEEAMVTHYKSAHEQPNAMLHKCLKCGKGFKTQTAMRMHNFIHASPSALNQSEKEFESHKTTSSKALKSRNQQSVSIEQKKCSTCGKQFFTKERLKLHMFIHEPSNRHLCSICGKRFKNSQDLIKHRAVHPVKLGCSSCNKTFKSYLSLGKHMGTHVDQRTCIICHKKVKDNSVLCKHIISHKDNHVCSICEMNFKTYQKLYYHKKSHFAAYSCDKCDTVYTTKRNLKVHVAKAH